MRSNFPYRIPEVMPEGVRHPELPLKRRTN